MYALRRPGDVLDLYLNNDLTSCFFLEALRGLLKNDPRLRLPVRGRTEAGLLLPLEFVEDSGVLARFRLGDPDPQEVAEWTGRIEWWLDLSGGILGNSTVEGPFVQVPSGRYHVEVCCHLPHSMGVDCLERAMGRPKVVQSLKEMRPEPFRKYWRRTRPGPPPSWLVALTSDREREKGDLVTPDDSALVEFVVRLTELTGEPPPFPYRRGRNGYVRTDAWETRVPSACPAGIFADVRNE